LAPLTQDLADKDDLIGTRTIPLTSIVKKDREKRIDLKDKAGKLVKGKDGQTTAIFLRLAGTRTQKSGSILDVPGDACVLCVSARLFLVVCVHLHLFTLNQSVFSKHEFFSRLTHSCSHVRPGLNPALYERAVMDLCERLSSQAWDVDVTLIASERLPSKLQPIPELCVMNTRSGEKVDELF
jgi:hypothetical protein